MAKALVLMRKAPYGSVYTAEGFRSVMGIGIFDLDVAIVFTDDGVDLTGIYLKTDIIERFHTRECLTDILGL
jgi:sulfur relay (sulfurtransferase) DsrF/TusC family protein